MCVCTCACECVCVCLALCLCVYASLPLFIIYQFLVTGCADGMICCYNLTDAKHLYIIAAHEGAVVKLCCRDKIFASLGGDQTVKTWHMEKGQCLRTIRLVS